MFSLVNLNKLSVNLIFPVDLYMLLLNNCLNHTNQMEVIPGFFNNHYLSFSIYASGLMQRTRTITDLFFLMETYLYHIKTQSIDLQFSECMKF
jgi:hypothetical protein